MSLLTELGATLSRVSEDLPTDEIRLAADRLQAATGLLGYVLHTTSRSIGLGQLAAATTNLEQAFAALARTGEALAEYQRSIGLGVSGAVTPPPASKKESAPRQRPKAASEPRQAAALDDWWQSRVDAITLLDDLPAERERDGSSREEKPPPAAELLRRVATLVRKEEPQRLRAELTKAGPAIGLRLTALCAPPLEELSMELLRRKPRPEDVPELHAKVDKLTARMLPGLPAELPDILLGRVCRAEPRHGTHGAPEHPVDAAVGGAVMVGALLATLRRPPESLTLPEDEEK